MYVSLCYHLLPLLVCFYDNFFEAGLWEAYVHEGLLKSLKGLKEVKFYIEIGNWYLY